MLSLQGFGHRQANSPNPPKIHFNASACRKKRWVSCCYRFFGVSLFIFVCLNSGCENWAQNFNTWNGNLTKTLLKSGFQAKWAKQKNDPKMTNLKAGLGPQASQFRVPILSSFSALHGGPLTGAWWTPSRHSRGSVLQKKHFLMPLGPRTGFWAVFQVGPAAVQHIYIYMYVVPSGSMWQFWGFSVLNSGNSLFYSVLRRPAMFEMAHHKPTKSLFLQYFQLVPAKFLGNKALRFSELHFALRFLWFFRAKIAT